MSLRWRIAMALGALAVVVAALASIGAFITTRAELRSSMDAALRTQVRDVGTGPGAGVGSRRGADAAGIDIDDDGCPPIGLVRTADAAEVISPTGAVRVCLTDGPLVPTPTKLPAAGEVLMSTAVVDGRTMRVAAAPYHDGGTLVLARDTAGTHHVLASLARWLVVMTIAVGAAAATVGWFLARRLVRPVVGLRDVVHSIAASGDLSVPIDARGVGEVGDLARSFSAMVDSLSTSREQQRRLVADAGHELRTPLTSLATNVELVERLDELPAEERPEVLKALRADVAELTDLSTELIDLATDRSSDEPVQRVDLADLAAFVVSTWSRRSGRSIELATTGEGTVLGRPQMLERCVGNLVQNAIKYSPEGTPIEVHVTADEVHVLDRGPGIAPAEAERVFERFYRSIEARTVPGSGLGLAIVRQVVERHGGSVWARAREGGGADVGFALPAGDPADVA